MNISDKVTKEKKIKELEIRFKIAPRKIRKIIIVPFFEIYKWNELPPYLTIKRKVKDTNIYVRVMLKDNLPPPERYESDE